MYRKLRAHKSADPLEYSAAPELAEYLLNSKREKLAALEERFGVPVRVVW